MIKVTLQLSNGLAQASPDGCLHLTLPCGANAKDVRQTAITQLNDENARQRLAQATLYAAGEALADDAVLNAQDVTISLRQDGLA
jgi:hypothetical protein